MATMGDIWSTNSSVGRNRNRYKLKHISEVPGYVETKNGFTYIPSHHK
jgi:hypothetical protein